MRFRKSLTIAVCLLGLVAVRDARAAGTWNGQDLYHVPLSWCVVQGSPAQANPNVAGDTVTDDLIWRRHERPTDFIFVNQAGITFRSAINDAWTVLDFPVIADPDTTQGTPGHGDMRGEDVNVAGAEFNQMITDCDAAWAAMGRAGIGITAVNAGLFHDGAGDYVGVIGWGGCVESLATGLCIAPYDGRIAVVDNRYLFPTVPDRTFPDGSGLQFTLSDPMDQLVGHELGHALSLPHRNSLTALMNPGPADNVGADGRSDNVALNAAEVADVRAGAVLVPGLEIDPPRQILPGNVVAMRVVDKVRERGLRPWLDLASLRATLDIQKKEVTLNQQLFGLLPKNARQQHWFFVDADNSTDGAGPDQLKRIGAPDTRFRGADLVLRADVVGQKVRGTAWRFRDGQLIRVPGVRFELAALVMHPHFAAIKGKRPPKEKRSYPVHHVISARFTADVLEIGLRRPFRVQTSVGAPGGRVDEIDSKEPERGAEIVLEHPSFPHCFAQADAAPGGTVKIDFEKLRPNAGIHALLGPRLVARGQTDARGGGTIELEIPRDTTPGLHLITIGNDRTALTADCVVNVRRAQ